MAMGRPQLPLGTYGKIRIYPHGSGFRAMTNYRDYDGKSRLVQRQGKTKAAAERALVTALRDRAHYDGGNTITPNTRLAVAAELYWEEIDESARSPSTKGLYRDRIDQQVLPALGEVRLREVTVGLVDRHLAAVKAKHGNAVAKTTRTVLSGICGLACRHDAMATNPCRDVSRISTKPKKSPRSLELDEIREVRTWLAQDKKAKDRDLPDLVDFMLATGLRLGETCAVRWQDADLDAGTVEVVGTVLRIKGQGLILKPSPKSEAGERILELPTWAVGMLRSRRSFDMSPGRVHRADTSPVFPAPLAGGLRDPANTRRGIREAFAEMGRPGLTSHIFRKTVASLMDSAGLTARAAADQLGHSKVSMTQDRYMGRKTRATGAAAVLEALADDPGR